MLFMVYLVISLALNEICRRQQIGAPPARGGRAMTHRNVPADSFYSLMIHPKFMPGRVYPRRADLRMVRIPLAH
ncbi:hypothetical protein BB778_03070 [Pluralibacter gergoviae]|nr:hypothetical protein BB778_03070 [Pluralibacter gergoviae]